MLQPNAGGPPPPPNQPPLGQQLKISSIATRTTNMLEFFEHSPPFPPNLIIQYANSLTGWDLELMPANVMERGGIILFVWTQRLPNPQSHYRQSITRLPILQHIPNLRKDFLTHCRAQNELPSQANTSRCPTCGSHLLGYAIHDHQHQICPLKELKGLDRLRFVVINTAALCNRCNSRSLSHSNCQPKPCRTCKQDGHSASMGVCYNVIGTDNQELQRIVQGMRIEHLKHVQRLLSNRELEYRFPSDSNYNHTRRVCQDGLGMVKDPTNQYPLHPMSDYTNFHSTDKVWYRGLVTPEVDSIEVYGIPLFQPEVTQYLQEVYQTIITMLLGAPPEQIDWPKYRDIAAPLPERFDKLLQHPEPTVAENPVVTILTVDPPTLVKPPQQVESGSDSTATTMIHVAKYNKMVGFGYHHLDARPQKSPPLLVEPKDFNLEEKNFILSLSNEPPLLPDSSAHSTPETVANFEPMAASTERERQNQRSVQLYRMCHPESYRDQSGATQTDLEKQLDLKNAVLSECREPARLYGKAARCSFQQEPFNKTYAGPLPASKKGWISRVETLQMVLGGSVGPLSTLDDAEVDPAELKEYAKDLCLYGSALQGEHFIYTMIEAKDPRKIIQKVTGSNITYIPSYQLWKRKDVKAACDSIFGIVHKSPKRTLERFETLPYFWFNDDVTTPLILTGTSEADQIAEEVAHAQTFKPNATPTNSVIIHPLELLHVIPGLPVPTHSKALIIRIKWLTEFLTGSKWRDEIYEKESPPRLATYVELLRVITHFMCQMRAEKKNVQIVMEECTIKLSTGNGHFLAIPLFSKYMSESARRWRVWFEHQLTQIYGESGREDIGKIRCHCHRVDHEFD